MPTIVCYPADFNQDNTLPSINDLTLQGSPITSYLATASGAAGLNLQFDWSRRKQLSSAPPGGVPSAGVNDDQLNTALASLLAASTASNPSPVGLLLADSYAAAGDQFGFMFDIEGEDGSFAPRQGCAVFLSAIHLAMPSNSSDADFRECVAFTALHELGHAFNLWHLDGPSIMQPHPTPGQILTQEHTLAQTRPPGLFTFDSTHCHYLALAADSSAASDILPGGSPFGVRPSGYPPLDPSAFSSPGPSPPKLKLKINLSHKALWSFEPIEIDVELSLSGSKTKPFSIPDEIDPGYASFQIWLTGPDGERFRFRPSVRFCQPNGKRVLTAGKPFRRDIPIFRHSGAYTFRVPGKYQVQAAVRLFSGKSMLSNITECEVLAANPGSTKWDTGSALLRTHEARNLLRYKSRPPSQRTYARLIQFVQNYASGPTASAIHYALGKAFVRSASRVSEPRSQKLRQRGFDHLRRLLDGGNLSRHRSSVATAMLEDD